LPHLCGEAVERFGDTGRANLRFTMPRFVPALFTLSLGDIVKRIWLIK
jgi:hypothetical protein